ncbi:MAG: hypothetical protein R3C05_22050 [Pirellulaceae bacterium]
MDAFFINCTTCSKRLKVRDESMIGQIFACPSCNAMVLVEPPHTDPTRLTIGRRDDVDSQAITSETIRDELESEGGFDGDTVDETLPTSDEDASASQADDLLNPSSPWKPSSYQGYRQFGMIALVSLIAIVSSVAIFGLFVQSSLEKQHTDASGTSVEQASLEDGSADPDPAGPGEGSLTDGTEQVAEAPIENSGVGTTSVESAQPPDSSGDEEAKTAATDPVQRERGGEGDPPSETPVSLEIAAPPVNANPDAAERIFSDAAAAPADPATNTMESLPDALKPFANIFGEGLQIEPAAPPREPVQQRPFQFRPLSKPSDRYPEPQPPMDIAKRLEQPLSMNLQAASLGETLFALAGMTSIPLTIDMQSLDSAGIGLDQELSGRYLDTSVGEAIGKVLSDGGCSLSLAIPGQAIVKAAEDRVTRFTAPALSLADFKEPQRAADLATQLSQRTDDPLATSIDPQTNTLSIDGSPAARWRVAIALEALRLSRQLPLTLPQERTMRWLCRGKPTGWKPPEMKDVVLEGDLPRPIQHWLDQVARQHQATVLIDWPGAWRNGLTPEFTILPWPSHGSVDSLEQELLSNFGLLLRDIGGGYWIVTSEQGFAMSERTAVLDFDANAKERLLERLALGMGYADPAELPAVIDPVSNRLIIRQPDYMLVQIADAVSGAK